MRAKSELIRQYIIEHLDSHPDDIAAITAKEFGISRQAVHRHLRILIDDEIVMAEGVAKNKRYYLTKAVHHFDLPIAENDQEDRVWRIKIAPLLVGYRPNVIDICHYGFTEMFNNVIDHSSGMKASVVVESTANSISMSILDDGVGIFEKLKAAYSLADHREAILELSKGKLTTDPDRHSGQGIFFTSRMFDEFSIRSGHLYFVHGNSYASGWMIETVPMPIQGTFVEMKISAQSTRTSKAVFDHYANPEFDYAFSKTRVLLSLARYGQEQLISRSQAKRVLNRLEDFEEVLLDFKGLDSVGQAFADEIFRVFARSHPGTRLVAVNTTPEVERMIQRAVSPGSAPSSPNPDSP